MHCGELEIREVFLSRCESDRQHRLRQLAEAWLRAVARQVQG